MANKTIAVCVAALAEAFGKTPSAATFKAYEMGLRGMSDAQVHEATQKALEKCRFMPSPAELREMVFVRTEDRAVKAWMAFEAAVRDCGYTRSVCFDDAIIHAVVKALGGWEACCEMPAAQFDTFLQKRFQDTYCALARSGISAEQASPLVGWFDRQNATHGYGAQRLVQIETGLPQLPSVRITQAQPQPERPADLPRLKLKRA